MNRFILLLLISFCFCTACKKNVATTPKEDYKIKLIEDNWNAAKAEATTNDKNIILMLHATWCNYCKTFIKDVITDQSIASALENKIVFALINAEEGDGPSLKSQYGGSGYPHFIIVESNGNKLAEKQGNTNSSEFLSLVTPYLK
jgi:thioredoxin-related protein